jgi:hypothetical protein
VLFTFFAVPSAQYNNLPPLFVSSPQPNPNKSQTTETAKIAVRTLEMEKNGRVPESVDIRRLSLIRERVGVNIFAPSGYVESAESFTDAGSPPTTHYVVHLAGKAVGCAALDGDTDDELRPTAENMAIAAVAIEKFHRTALHRATEWTYVRVFSTIMGRMPDLSLGPAQIKLSQIHKIAREFPQKNGPYAILRMSDSELTEMLSDECQSLKLAASLMYYFLSKVRQTDSCKLSSEFHCEEETAAAAFAGQRRRTTPIIGYGPVITAMIGMIGS